MTPLGHSCMDMAEMKPPAGRCWPREPPTPLVSISPGEQAFLPQEESGEADGWPLR